MLGRFTAICLIVFLVSLAFTAPASAAPDISPGWGKWWLPHDRSEHGHAIDTLFHLIFWITMIIFVVTEVVLVYFLVKYRDRPGAKKAYFTHGNPKLEMAWTIAPAVILAGLALGSKKAWDAYRYAPAGEDPNRTIVLVIGEQFAWNFVYPGKDGKLGKYMMFPKPSDAKWPVGADGQPTTFADVTGPAALPYKEAVGAINRYIEQVNRLGKDYSDPDGKDDDLAPNMQASRGLILPANRPVEIQLTSKDVIHDFFLPNHRVKMDAVPGMRGRIFFKAVMTSSERAEKAAKKVPVDTLEEYLKTPEGQAASIIINEGSSGPAANKNRDGQGWRYITSANQTIIRTGTKFQAAEATRATQIQRLKDAGITEISMTSDTGNWELVCEELCGQGHNTMTSVVTFVSPEEYNRLNRDKEWSPAAAPSTAPAAP